METYDIEREIDYVNQQIYIYQEMEDDLRRAIKYCGKVDSGISQLKGSQQDKVIQLFVNGLGSQESIVDNLRIRHTKLTDQNNNIEEAISTAIKNVEDKIQGLYSKRNKLYNELWS